MRVGQRAAVTDTGRKRRRNEDAFVLRPPLFAVADGMGGAQAGEIASRLATEALGDDEAGGTAVDRVRGLVQAANRRVYDRSTEDAAVSGMGTTITLALVEDALVTIGHVGDSRAYLAREGSLEQLTQDHSLVGELVRSGKLSQEEAESHPQRSVITRALGTDPDVDVDVVTLETRPGDVFLLCSDGLTSMVADDVILSTLEEHRDDLDAAARSLISRANRGGGEDNITVVCFEIASEPAGSGAEPDDAARLPAVEEPAPEPDEEDTLDELDGVPVLETTIASPEQVAALETPPGAAERSDGDEDGAPPAASPQGDGQQERLNAVARRVLAVLVALLVVAGALVLLWWSLA